MEKRNVFVHVKTQSECKKLYKMLKEMNQEVNDSTDLGLKTGFDIDGDSQFDWPYIYLQYPDVWIGHSEKPSVREVSIKELKNILLK